MSIVRIITTNDTVWQYNVKNVLANPSALTPSEGHRYLIISGAGDWAGQSNKIATWHNSAWVYTNPKYGMYVYNETTGALNKYTTEWLPAFTHVGSTPPTLKVEGTLWFSTTDMLLYYWDSSNSRNAWLSINRNIIDFVRTGNTLGGGAAALLKPYGNSNTAVDVGAYLPYDGMILSYKAYVASNSNDLTKTFNVSYYSDANTTATLAVTLPGISVKYTAGLNLPIAKERIILVKTSTTVGTVNTPGVELEIAYKANV